MRYRLLFVFFMCLVAFNIKTCVDIKQKLNALPPPKVSKDVIMICQRDLTLCGIEVDGHKFMCRSNSAILNTSNTFGLRMICVGR